jgi:hypothetical protein
MKLPNCTKKRKTRATLYTFKIRSLIKREMRLKNNRLSKIGSHISTNRRIKLRENRRNIKLFTNKHKVITTFIHVSNDIKLCKGVLIYSITEQLGTRRKKKYSITEQLGTRRKKKYSITEQLGTRRKKKCNKVMFTTSTSPRFADDGSCQHHLEHALQVQAESAQNFVSFYHQKNEMKDRT